MSPPPPAPEIFPPVAPALRAVSYSLSINGFDIPSVILNQGGKEIVIPVASCVLDVDEPSIMKVNVGEIPSGSVLKGASFGTESAFGKSCDGYEGIPSSMVYARATFSSIG